MSAMTISFVLVRLAATFLFVRGIQGLTAFSYLLSAEEPIDGYGAFTLVFGVILPIAIAMVLWTWPEKIAGAQTMSARNVGADTVTADQVMMIGLSMLGLYVLVYGVVDLFAVESAHIVGRRHQAPGGLPDLQEARQMFASRVRYAAQIVLGLALLLGRNGISVLLTQARYAGVARPAERVVTREDGAQAS